MRYALTSRALSFFLLNFDSIAVEFSELSRKEGMAYYWRPCGRFQRTITQRRERVLLETTLADRFSLRRELARHTQLELGLDYVMRNQKFHAKVFSFSEKTLTH